MDDIVKRAMAKWPNVPHCYGWLALDARGNWRMRDERTQALGLAGDRINNPALLGFINRNYLHDDQGRWYFQNGPQRVYVNLEATPYIARTDPAQGLVLQTGEVMATIDGAWLTEEGQLLFKSAEKIAMLDDRDMAQCLSRLRIDGIAVEDERLLSWLAKPQGQGQGQDQGLGQLTFDDSGKQIIVQRIMRNAIAGQFGFTQKPLPLPDEK
jgi:hypothetical protein